MPRFLAQDLSALVCASRQASERSRRQSMQFILDHVLLPLLGRAASGESQASPPWLAVPALAELPLVPGCAHALDDAKLASPRDHTAANGETAARSLHEASDGKASSSAAVSAALGSLSLKDSANSSAAATSNATATKGPEQWHVLDAFAHGNFARASDFVHATDHRMNEWVFWPVSPETWVT